VYIFTEDVHILYKHPTWDDFIEWEKYPIFRQEWDTQEEEICNKLFRDLDGVSRMMKQMFDGTNRQPGA